MNKPVVLLILDGIGVDIPSNSNAVSLADKYNLDYLISKYFTTTLKASSEFVGLPFGVPGNSEIGHLNIGAGKIVYQDLLKINKSIQDKSFFVNQYFLEAIFNAKKKKKALHLIGTLSYSPKNSLIEHFYSLLELIRSEGLENFYLHLILDGKDFENNAGLSIIKEVQDRLNIMGVGKIATISGRYYGMDRDYNWDRVEIAYNAIVNGISEKINVSPIQAVEASYKDKDFDDQLFPVVITDKDKKPLGTVNTGDSVIFFNFKPDKIRQLTKSIVIDDFDEFERKKQIKNMYFVTMTEYERDLPVNIAFRSDDINSTLTSVISDNNLRQLHISETEKYSHVTFFINGAKDLVYKGEDRILIPSLVNYSDPNPEGNIFELVNELVDSINADKYDFIVANIPNAEVCAHSGKINKTIKAVQYIDKAVGELVDTVLNKDGVLLITSDHGNAEKMMSNNKENKDHTLNPVPLIIVGKSFENKNCYANFNILSSVEPTGVIADICPTILKILGLKKPEEMTRKELI